MKEVIWKLALGTCLAAAVLAAGPLSAGKPPKPPGDPTGPQYDVVDLLPGAPDTSAAGGAVNNVDGTGAVDVAGSCPGRNPCLWTVSPGATSVQPVLLPRWPGDRAAWTYDLNDAEPPLVVGYSDLGYDVSGGGFVPDAHPAVWRKTSDGWHLTLLPFPSGLPRSCEEGRGRAVDNAARIIGDCWYDDGYQSTYYYALLWECGPGEDCLDTSDWTVSILPMEFQGTTFQECGAFDINDTGWILGECDGANLVWRWDGSVWAIRHLLPCGPPATGCTALNINDSGDASGSVALTSVSDRHAALWVFDGSAGDYDDYRDLGTLRGGYSAAGGLTERTASGLPVVVGGATPTRQSDPMRGEFVATRWKDGVLSDLNDLIPRSPSWWLTSAGDANSTGWITGHGEVDGNKYDHGFLLVPRP